MKLDTVNLPICSELFRVSDELGSQFHTLTEGSDHSNGVVGYFMNARGKMLRPALILLSAHVAETQSNFPADKVIQLAIAAELIHNASLIHDDIIDGSDSRRGHLTLNHVFSTKLAVLAGDLLYSRAISILSRNFESHITGILSNSAEQMCVGEIDAAQGPMQTVSQYLKLIHDKTALFMSACCKCGALVSGRNNQSEKALSDFGLNFGLSYQLFDDYEDQDIPLSIDLDLPATAYEYAGKAKDSLASVDDSAYKQSLLGLVDYVAEKYHTKNEIEPIGLHVK